MAPLQQCVRGTCLAVGLLLLVGNQVAGQESSESIAVESAAPAPRPPALIPLYISYSVTQGLDVLSTRQALERGGREGNPFTRSLGGSTAAMTAIKMGSTAGTVLLTEMLWKRHRATAIVMMVALNAVNVVVVAHNFSVGR